MAEKKSSKGCFQRVVSSGDLWKDRIPPHQVSLTMGQQQMRMAPAPARDPLPHPSAPPRGRWGTRYMDFMPLAVAPSGSPSPTAAASWRPE